MAKERKYIGAKYVPTYFKNVDGSSTWISGIPYPPLTIVTNGNVSYTSKKYVPAGISIYDQEYWHQHETGETTTVINSLTSDSVTAALSAAQGKRLKEMIPAIENRLDSEDEDAALSAAQGKTLNEKMDNLLTVERKYLAQSTQIEASGYGTISADVSKDGYEPIGIVGFATDNVNVFVYNMLINNVNNNATIAVKNMTASPVVVQRPSVYVLYRKVGA